MNRPPRRSSPHATATRSTFSSLIAVTKPSWPASTCLPRGGKTGPKRIQVVTKQPADRRGTQNGANVFGFMGSLRRKNLRFLLVEARRLPGISPAAGSRGELRGVEATHGSEGFLRAVRANDRRAAASLLPDPDRKPPRAGRSMRAIRSFAPAKTNGTVTPATSRTRSLTDASGCSGTTAATVDSIRMAWCSTRARSWASNNPGSSSPRAGCWSEGKASRWRISCANRPDTGWRDRFLSSALRGRGTTVGANLRVGL